MDERGLGAYLSNLRQQRHWSVTDAALRIGLSKSHLSQIESGKIGLPNAHLRRQIANAYGIRHVDLLVAAGELTPDEVAPLPENHIHDHRLAEIVQHWPLLREPMQVAVHGMFRQLSADPLSRVEPDEEPVVAVSR